MNIKYSYVDWIQDNVITVYCFENKKTNILKSIQAKRKLFRYNCWKIVFKNDQELAEILKKLRDCDFLFSYDEHGWSPSGIFQLLRERGMLSGKYKEIYWSAPNKVGFREL